MVKATTRQTTEELTSPRCAIYQSMFLLFSVSTIRQTHGANIPIDRSSIYAASTYYYYVHVKWLLAMSAKPFLFATGHPSIQRSIIFAIPLLLGHCQSNFSGALVELVSHRNSYKFYEERKKCVCSSTTLSATSTTS